MRLAIGRLYAPSNRGQHPQHPIQLLLFASSLDIDREPQSAYDRFIDSSNRGLHKFPAGSTQEVIPTYSRKETTRLVADRDLSEFAGLALIQRFEPESPELRSAIDSTN